MILDGIIFDLEGTLAETRPICVSAYRDTLLEFRGRKYSEGEILELIGPSEEGIFERLVPEHWQACVAAFHDNYDRAHAELRSPYAGLTDIFHRLKTQGIKLAIATEKGPGSAAISVRNLGLATYIDLVETGSPSGNCKMRSIASIVSKWGTAPAFVAYLGDEASDIAAARVANVQALAAAWSESARAEELAAAKPRELFRTVPEFANWVSRNIQANV
jgi:pyrophosphatase PpaX